MNPRESRQTQSVKLLPSPSAEVKTLMGRRSACSDAVPVRVRSTMGMSRLKVIVPGGQENMSRPDNAATFWRGCTRGNQRFSSSSTQLEDGSWYVRTRASPIQPYFESGFPHGRDQWISAAATNWATMALAL